jgi:hypothetical protein
MEKYINQIVAIDTILSNPPDAHYPVWFAEQIANLSAADVVEVVRCKKCKHSKELAPHSEISPYYRHCSLWRGEETKNVWHKYKKYYADYSIVEPTDFCSYGERKESEVDTE